MHSAIDLLAGLEKRFQGNWAIYCGTADSIVAAGLVTLDMLPGKGKNPRGLIVYEPNGERRASTMGPVVAGMLRIICKRVFGGLAYEVWQRLGDEVAMHHPTPAWPFPVVVGALPLMEARA